MLGSSTGGHYVKAGVLWSLDKSGYPGGTADKGNLPRPTVDFTLQNQSP